MCRFHSFFLSPFLDTHLPLGSLSEQSSQLLLLTLLFCPCNNLTLSYPNVFAMSHSLPVMPFPFFSASPPPFISHLTGLCPFSASILSYSYHTSSLLFLRFFPSSTSLNLHRFRPLLRLPLTLCVCVYLVTV